MKVYSGENRFAGEFHLTEFQDNYHDAWFLGYDTCWHRTLGVMLNELAGIVKEQHNEESKKLDEIVSRLEELEKKIGSPDRETKEELINSLREDMKIIEDKFANCLKLLEDN